MVWNLIMINLHTANTKVYQIDTVWRIIEKFTWNNKKRLTPKAGLWKLASTHWKTCYRAQMKPIGKKLIVCVER